jgi:hypothetical protein
MMVLFAFNMMVLIADQYFLTYFTQNIARKFYVERFAGLVISYYVFWALILLLLNFRHNYDYLGLR